MINITAYWDASHSIRTKRAVATSIVLSENMFHGMVTETYTNVDTGAHAELLGIIQTVRLVKDIPDVDTITIYCDSESVISLYSKLLNSEVLSQYTNYYNDWIELLELSKGLNIKAGHIQGHSKELSCNTVCDIVAHQVLRWENT